MALILGLGSNIGDRVKNINKALTELNKIFTLKTHSHFYKSDAVDYLDQPYFINSVAEFLMPNLAPSEIMQSCLNIEQQLGRNRLIAKGPRVIDIDILFCGVDSINQKNLTVPHPRLFSRSFVVTPLKEMPFFTTLNKHFRFNEQFNVPSELYSLE